MFRGLLHLVTDGFVHRARTIKAFCILRTHTSVAYTDCMPYGVLAATLAPPSNFITAVRLDIKVFQVGKK